MMLNPGVHLGPYRVVSSIGAGGMGEVYRAHDGRLQRDVALKVMHVAMAADTAKLQRFEQEARAASALNHPNIMAVHDIGAYQGMPYLVAELLEGQNLRERMSEQRAPFPLHKAMHYALQIAHGLAAAHEKGIVHRDLKPENLFLTRDGRIKILDFGLAKLRTEFRLSADTLSDEGKLVGHVSTEPGVIMGTIGYMAPEQVQGQPVDQRADIFSFGAILYELLVGRPAFDRPTPMEIMMAILKEEPPALYSAVGSARALPPALERITHRCLEKDANERFHSARDLAFALEAISSGFDSQETRPATEAKKAPLIISRRATLLAGAGLVGATGTAMFGAYRLNSAAQRPPTFQRLTFRRGNVVSARFAPDGLTVVYSAVWEERPKDLYFVRTESPESRSLDQPETRLLAISSSGEMAVLRKPRVNQEDPMRSVLAQLPLGGGSQRDVATGVAAADWGPDRTLAVARMRGGRMAIEWPFGAGKPLHEFTGWTDCIRVSPDGNWLAVAYHPLLNDTRGSVRLYSRDGQVRELSREFPHLFSVAFRPDGREVWFSASDTGTAMTLFAQPVPSGRERLVLRNAGSVGVQDISRDGRVLFTLVNTHVDMYVLAPGQSAESDLTWFDGSQATDLSADGKLLLFTEDHEAGGPTQSVYLRKNDGSSAPVRLGQGMAQALSPDGQWALTHLYEGGRARLVLWPTGAGERIDIAPDPQLTYQPGALFMPNGKKILFKANQAERPARWFMQELGGGGPQALLPERHDVLAVSPNERHLLVASTNEKDGGFQFRLQPIAEGAEARPISGLLPTDWPIRFSSDGDFLYVHAGGLSFDESSTLLRMNLQTGAREPIRAITPGHGTEYVKCKRLHVTADGNAYAYSCQHLLSDLYLARELV